MERRELGGIFAGNLSALAEGNSRFIYNRPRAASRSRLQPGPLAFLWRGGRTRVVAFDSGRPQPGRMAAEPARIWIFVGWRNYRSKHARDSSRETRRRPFGSREGQNISSQRTRRAADRSAAIRCGSRIGGTWARDHRQFAPGIGAGTGLESERAFQSGVFRRAERAAFAGNNGDAAGENVRLVEGPGIIRICAGGRRRN